MPHSSLSGRARWVAAAGLFAVLLAALPLAHAADRFDARPVLVELDSDPYRRPLVAVTINGQGPFDFILDTGANRTSVSPRLAQELGLVTDHRREIDGVTGPAIVDIVMLDRLEAGALRLDAVAAPVVNQHILGSTYGLLGVDALAGLRVAFDFNADTVEIGESGAPLGSERGGASDGAQVLSSGLAQTTMRIGDLDIAAIIDTGADATLGNPALRDAIGAQRWRDWRRFDADILGASETVVRGEVAVMRNLRLGQTRFLRAPVVVADLHVFRVLNISAPAMVLGMDILEHAETLVIDYGTGEVAIGGTRSPAQIAERLRRRRGAARCEVDVFLARLC